MINKIKEEECKNGSCFNWDWTYFISFDNINRNNKKQV